MMNFKNYLAENIAVFEFSGKLMGGANATMFQGRLMEYINLNKNRVLLDLNQVDWTNSRGLGMLLLALTTVKNSGGRLALSNIDNLESLLATTRLATVFEHFDSKEKAMTALREERIVN